MDWNLVAVEGDKDPIFAGDTIKILTAVLGDDGQTFTGDIIAARHEIMQLADNEMRPLNPPLYKDLGEGVSLIEGGVLETVFIPDDTAALDAETYVAALRVRSPDFGERTTVRRIALARQAFALP
jgi:hypothetical protein